MWQLSMSVVPHSPSASQNSPHATTSQFSKSASAGHSEASTGTSPQPHGWNVGRGVGSDVVGMAVVGMGDGCAVVGRAVVGAGVGKGDGSGDGTAVVGDGVGQEVGTGDGDAVVGAGVGMGAGTGVGTEVGSSVGAGVGSGDGACVGVGVGTSVGADVGLEDGTPVGNGETDGAEVDGTSVGLYVVGIDVGVFGSKKEVGSARIGAAAIVAGGPEHGDAAVDRY